MPHKDYFTVISAKLDNTEENFCHGGMHDCKEIAVPLCQHTKTAVHIMAMFRQNLCNKHKAFENAFFNTMNTCLSSTLTLESFR